MYPLSTPRLFLCHSIMMLGVWTSVSDKLCSSLCRTSTNIRTSLTYRANHTKRSQDPGICRSSLSAALYQNVHCSGGCVPENS